MKLLSLLLLTLFTLPSLAQDTLRTINTEYTRIHFHQDYRQFAEQVALKIDPIYQDVGQRIGFTNKHKVDVLISDKYHQANGSAMPLASGPILNIYTSSPRSEQSLGHYSDWLDLVLSHELAHHIHLIEPSRSWRAIFDKFILEADFANLSRYPRWAIEGYATVIETEFTQQGRVNSDYVNALLAQWAVEGQLPSYNAMNGRERYQGNRMAYMQGSAFLIWLQQNYSQGEDDKIGTLAKLWRRSTAKEYRNFEKAFTGLFLEHPEVLYKRFVAEQIYLAKQGQATDVSGKLWLKNREQILASEPSPDEKHILQLEYDHKNGQQLSVYSLAENSKAKTRFVEKNSKLIAQDPQDIADTMPAVFNRTAKFTFYPERGKSWRHARWLDKDNVLLLQRQLQQNRELGFELAKLNLASGEVTLISRGLRIQDFALTPDKQSVLAVRHYAGLNQLVKVALNDGSWQALTHELLNTPMDNLSISADGKQLALMAIADKRWHIHLLDLADNVWQKIALPISGNYVSHLRWQGNSLYISHSSKDKNNNARVNVYRLNLVDQTWQQLTFGHQLATDAFVIDDKLLFTVTQSRGQSTFAQPLPANSDVSVSVKASANNNLAKGKFELQPSNLLAASSTSHAGNPAQTQVQTQVQNKVQSQNYGLGPQAFTSAVLSGYVSNDDSGGDLLLRGGDPLGRLQWQGVINQSDLQSNQAIQVKSRWQSITAYGEWVNNDFDVDYFQRQNQALNIEVAYQYPFFEHVNWQGKMGLGREKITTATIDDTLDSYRFESELDFLASYKKAFYGASFDAALIDYQGDTSAWQRNDLLLGAFVGYSDYALRYQYQQFRLDDDAPEHALLSYGGQQSSAASQVKNAQLLDPRLPLAWQTGHEFSQHSASLGSGASQLFYLQHQSDQQETLDAYGIEFAEKLSDVGPLLNGLTVKAGLTWYQTPAQSDEQQFYFALSYLLK
ncbi:TolB family protein [Thalassotalea sp. PLHSN55]|uniref:TolB family protein n=1 Tax=Thalassotalea sp. PLHSN55 TaxID=3435888 RepID=UPI003F846A8C